MIYALVDGDGNLLSTATRYTEDIPEGTELVQVEQAEPGEGWSPVERRFMGEPVLPEEAELEQPPAAPSAEEQLDDFTKEQLVESFGVSPKLTKPQMIEEIVSRT